MTPEQIDLIRIVYDYTTYHGFAPTLREIGTRQNRKAVSQVSGSVKYLSGEGYLTYRPARYRSIVITGKGLAAIGVGYGRCKGCGHAQAIEAVE